MASERTAKLAATNHWDELLTLRDRQREQPATASRSSRRPSCRWKSNRQGLMRWYLHPAIKDTCLSVLMFFQQEIPPGSRSGRLKFQGGQVMMITEGQGLHHASTASSIPGKRATCVNLPLRADGIIVQHFNTDPDKPARFVATEPNWLECVIGRSRLRLRAARRRARIPAQRVTRRRRTMAEIERVRERERPPLKDNPYERVMARAQGAAERNLTGPVVMRLATQQEMVPGAPGQAQVLPRPGRRSRTRRCSSGACSSTRSRPRSGKHRHQGGLVIYVLEGKGYSIVDGERKDWEKGDLVLLPMKPGWRRAPALQSRSVEAGDLGGVHQHPDPGIPGVGLPAGGGLAGLQGVEIRDGPPLRPHPIVAQLS